ISGKIKLDKRIHHADDLIPSGRGRKEILSRQLKVWVFLGECPCGGVEERKTLGTAGIEGISGQSADRATYKLGEGTADFQNSTLQIEHSLPRPNPDNLNFIVQIRCPHSDSQRSTEKSIELQRRDRARSGHVVDREWCTRE